MDSVRQYLEEIKSKQISDEILLESKDDLKVLEGVIRIIIKLEKSLNKPLQVLSDTQGVVNKRLKSRPSDGDDNKLKGVMYELQKLEDSLSKCQERIMGVVTYTKEASKALGR